MTKTELMETYTAEQLAGMVINLQSASEVKNDEIHKLKWQISSLEEDNGRLQAKLDTYNNYLLPRCTKEAKEMIDRNHFSGVTVVSLEQLDNRIKKESNEPDIRGYEETIDGLQSEVEKYRKAFEEAKKERDCQVAEYRKKIEELEHDLKTAGEKIQDLVGENMKLQCERNDYKSKSEFLEVERMRVKKNEFSDFPPTEPIKVAEMLINASKKRTNCMTGKEYDKYIFEKWQLRQIAEHLLVYCNHNGEVEEC